MRFARAKHTLARTSEDGWTEWQHFLATRARGLPIWQ
jgi:hypothetical protein